MSLLIIWLLFINLHSPSATVPCKLPQLLSATSYLITTDPDQLLLWSLTDNPSMTSSYNNNDNNDG